MKNFKCTAELKEFYSYHLDSTIVLVYLFYHTSLSRFFNIDNLCCITELFICTYCSKILKSQRCTNCKDTDEYSNLLAPLSWSSQSKKVNKALNWGFSVKTVQMEDSVKHQKKDSSPVWVTGGKRIEVRIFLYLTRLSKNALFSCWQTTYLQK